MLTGYSSGSVQPDWIASEYQYGRFKSGSYYTTPFEGFYSFDADFVFQKIDPLGTEHGTFVLELIDGGTGSIASIMTGGFVHGTVLDTVSRIIPTTATSYSEYEIALQTVAFLPANHKIFFRLKTNYTQVSYDRVSDIYDTSGIFIQPWGHLNYEAVSMDATLCRDLAVSPANLLFDSSSITSNTISLTQATNYFFNSSSTYDPAYTDVYNPSASLLYGQFGEAYHNMSPDLYDNVWIYYSAGTLIPGSTLGGIKPLRFSIINIDTGSSGTTRFTVSPDFPSYLTPSNVNLYDKIVFTKQVPDETVVILNGKKRPGDTSYGFLVPENINPTIQKNINTLQSTIQSQILNY